ncbi:MAG: hypothetical protein Q9161_001325 [Pseudevernia consocians]
MRFALQRSPDRMPTLRQLGATGLSRHLMLPNTTSPAAQIAIGHVPSPLGHQVGQSTQTKKLNLAVTGACRQLYEQEHHILWTTNTFSFDDAVSFGKFMVSLNIAQLHKLKSLHLSRVTEDQRSPTPTTRCADEVTNHWAGTIACEPSRIKVLRGLRTLHVCLEQCLRSCNALVPVHDYNRRRIQQDAQPFLQLRILALEHVAVIVSDNPDFIKRKKNEVAEEIRVKLLDPEGAATLRAEKNAKKLEREGKRLDERDGIEKRRENREERAKAEKVQRDQAGQAKTETINKHLEQQIGGAVRRGWMK